MRFAPLLAFAAAGFVGFAGCTSAGTSAPRESVGSTSGAVFGSDDTTHTEVGFPVVQAGIAGYGEESGVLLTPTLAVVGIRSVVKGYSFGTGTFTTGGSVCATLGATVDPGQVVFVPGDGRANTNQPGGEAYALGTPVKQIITNGEVDSCKAGFAFLVLAQPINGFPYPQIVFDKPPNANDPVTGCGWGRINTHCAYPTALQCATGNVILPNGGYYAPDQDTFPPGIAVTSVPTCYNDVGGGVFDQSGALLGTFDKYFQPDKTKVDTFQEACLSCDGAVADVFLFSGYQDFVARAFAAVGSSPWRAGHPKPVDVGGPCTDNLDCNSQYCVTVGAAKYCSQDCSTTACPASTVCTNVESQSVCLPQVTPHPASCAVSTTGTDTNASGTGAGNTRPLALTALTALIAGLVIRRRRSARSAR